MFIKGNISEYARQKMSKKRVTKYCDYTRNLINIHKDAGIFK